MRIVALVGGAAAAAGVVGIAVSSTLIDPYISAHIPKTPDAIHTLAWIHKSQLLGYVSAAEAWYSRTALWLFLAMAALGTAVAYGKRDGSGEEAFETFDARNWGYLAGAIMMLPGMLLIYYLLQH